MRFVTIHMFHLIFRDKCPPQLQTAFLLCMNEKVLARCGQISKPAFLKAYDYHTSRNECFYPYHTICSSARVPRTHFARTPQGQSASPMMGCAIRSRRLQVYSNSIVISNIFLKFNSKMSAGFSMFKQNFIRFATLKF